MDTSIIATLDTFFTQFPKQSFEKGDVIIHPGSEPSGIVYIQEGVIRRYWIAADGSEMTLNLYKQHAFLPMSWAMTSIPNVHGYDAITHVKLHTAPKEEVLQFVKQNPEVLYDLLKRVYIGMEGMWTHIETMTRGNAYEKVIITLVILTKRFGKTEGKTIAITLPLTEQDIASYAGTARETVNRALQQLKKEGIVTIKKGKITISNLATLESLLLT